MGKVPESGEKTDITPVFQKGKEEDLGNHRPVILTSFTEKMMEQLILETMSKHMKDKKVIWSHQHRFTKGKS